MQPTLRREGDARLTGASLKKGKCAESPPTFIQGKCRKNRKKHGLRTLSVKGSRVVFTHGEGIRTPIRPSQRTTTFNQVCKYDFKLFYFPFFTLFMSFYALFVFLFFCGRQGCFPCSYVFLNGDKEIRPT